VHPKDAIFDHGFKETLVDFLSSCAQFGLESSPPAL